MLKFSLYCDLSTMNNCTTEDINKELSNFSTSYIQVNDSLWFFKYPEGFDGSFLSKEVHLFYDYFEKFTNDESIIFLQILGPNDFYNLPEKAFSFLQQD